MVTSQKIAYLTIDDSPSRDMRQKVDYLVKQDIPTVWFCRGDYMEQRPEPVVHAINQGHIIGNHLYDHPQCSDLTLEQIYDQVKRTEVIIDQLYQKADKKRPGHFLRFPYGDKGDLRYGDITKPLTQKGAERKDALQQFLREQGFTQPLFEKVTYVYHREQGIFSDVDWRWTFDVMEYAPHRPGRFRLKTMSDVFERMDHDDIENGIGLNHSQSAEILLMHDHPETTNVFEEIIQKFLSKNFGFVPIERHNDLV